MNFNYSKDSIDYHVFQHLAGSNKENYQRQNDRFIPHRTGMITAEKPTTLYEEVLYKTMFNGRDVNNSILSINRPTHSNNLNRYDIFEVNQKPLITHSLDGFDYVEAVHPVSWVKTNEFILSFQNTCYYYTGNSPKILNFYDKPDTPINAIHFDPNSTKLAVTHKENPYYIYDVESQKTLFKSKFIGKVQAPKIQLEDSICSYMCGSSFYMQDIREKGITKNVYTMGNDTNHISSFDYTKSKNNIALSTIQGNLSVVDKVARKIRFSDRLDTHINDIKWEPQSSAKFATAGNDGMISIYDIDSDKNPRIIKTEDPVFNLIWNETKCLLSGHDNQLGSINIWDTATLDLKETIEITGSVNSMTPSLDKSHFVAIGENLKVYETPHIKKMEAEKQPILKRKACSILDDYPTIR